MHESAASYDVFLSYSRADSLEAETLRSRLKEAGLSAFLDRYGLPAGQPWQPWLEAHLASCRALVVLVGPMGFGEWQHREIELGLDRQASAAKTGQAFPVIPVLLPKLANDAVPIGSFLSLNTWVDLRKNLDEPEGLQRLVAGAQGRAIDVAADERPLAGLTPYRGLRPFREQDAGLFFGRGRFVEELVRKVTQRTATNVVAVIGRSGSGKSSVVYSGLFPKLRGEKGLSRQAVWQILDLRPHAEPLNQLANAFDPSDAKPGSAKYREHLNDGAKRFRDGKISLAELVRDRLQTETGSTRLLLYIDQWEELYTQALRRELKKGEDPAQPADDVRLFIDLVLEAAAKSPCTLVLSVRSDFYSDVQSHDSLRSAVQESQISLGTMNEAELRDVIEGPAKELGASVDKKLTERLIRDIGLDLASGRSDEYDIGKLPLLEYALEQAWAKRAGPKIGLPEYSGLEQALEERANALFGGLSAAEQAAAKRLFVSLVTPGEGREDTRARIVLPDDPAMQAVVETFAGPQGRLIVTDETGGRRSVEVSHEALIRHWDKLGKWIDENRDNLRTRARLRDNRAEWLKHDRDPGLLDLPSLHLEAARKLFAQPGDVVIDEIKDYIEALLKHDWQRQEDEASEREGKRRKELELAEERAEAARLFAEARKSEADAQKREAEQAKRVVRRTGLGLAAALALAVIAGGLAFFSIKERDRALLQESRALTTLALEASKDGDQPKAMLLALEALPDPGFGGKRPWSSEAAAALLQAWLRNQETMLAGQWVVSASLSADATHVVTASADGTARVWDLSSPRPKFVALDEHDRSLHFASFSKDGKRVVTMSDTTARVWDWQAESPSFVTLDLDLDQRVYDRSLFAEFSADRTHLVTTSRDGAARVWDLRATPPSFVILDEGAHVGAKTASFSADGTQVLLVSNFNAAVWDLRAKPPSFITLGQDDVSAASISSDGKHAVTASRDGTARVWDLQSDHPTFVPLEGHKDGLVAASFSPDGKHVVTASKDRTARVWDLQGDHPTFVPLEGHRDELVDASFSGDGEHVVTVSKDRMARVWDLSISPPSFVPQVLEGFFTSASLSFDGAHLVTLSGGNVRVWNMSGQQRGFVVLAEQHGPITSASFSADGTYVVTAANDKTAGLWDLRVKPPIFIALEGHRDKVTSASFSRDCKHIVTASRDGTARVWDLSARPPTSLPLEGHRDVVNSASFSPDGNYVVTASADNTARIWDLHEKRPSFIVLEGHEKGYNSVISASFSSDGAFVVTASEDGTARVWDWNNSQPTFVPLEGHSARIHSGSFSPDGSRVVTASEDGTARVWDLHASPPNSATLDGSGDDSGGGVRSASFSVDGVHVVTASWEDDTTWVWDVRGPRPSFVPLEGPAGVNSASFSADGKHVVAALENGTAQVWDLRGERPSSVTLEGHRGAVNSASFSADGYYVVTASDDGTARVWPVFPNVNELIDTARASLSRCLSQAERDANGLFSEHPVHDRNFIPPPTADGRCPS